MSDKEKKNNIKWLEKLKNVKHIEIYIGIIFIVVILLIYLSSSGGRKTSTDSTKDMTVISYVENLEKNLEDSLSNIAGVSDVKVMITLQMNEADVKDDEIVITKFPAIKGVLITAKGVNDTKNKLKVLQAVQSVIDITNGNIEILSSE